MIADSPLLRIMAAGVSVALHALFFFQFGGAVSIAPVQQQVSQATVTRIHIVASPKVPSVATPEPESVKPELARPTPKPALRTAHREHAKPKPLKPRPVAKPRREADSEHIQKVEKKPASIAQPTIARAAVAPAPVKQLSVDDGLVARERLKYLAKVMAHIEQHKYYPPTARRRGIQGNVSISFLLLADGSIRHLMIKGGPHILRKAGAQSVKKALPMPKTASKLSFPLQCSFSMQFAFI